MKWMVGNCELIMPDMSVRRQDRVVARAQDHATDADPDHETEEDHDLDLVDADQEVVQVVDEVEIEEVDQNRKKDQDHVTENQNPVPPSGIEVDHATSLDHDQVQDRFKLRRSK